jgi:hypothetical protein
MEASPMADPTEPCVLASPGNIYAVRFPWSGPWDEMFTTAEELFGWGTVIEFDLGMMAAYPCIDRGDAVMLVYTTDNLANGAKRDCAALGQDIAIERVWPATDEEAKEAIAQWQAAHDAFS